MKATNHKEKTMKIKTYPHGYASMEKTGQLYTVKVYIGTELHDKIRCDDYRSASEYFRAFAAIAKNA
jgi:hypothetical protein